MLLNISVFTIFLNGLSLGFIPPALVPEIGKTLINMGKIRNAAKMAKFKYEHDKHHPHPHGYKVHGGLHPHHGGVKPHHGGKKWNLKSATPDEHVSGMDGAVPVTQPMDKGVIFVGPNDSIKIHEIDTNNPTVSLRLYTHVTKPSAFEEQEQEYLNNMWANNNWNNNPFESMNMRKRDVSEIPEPDQTKPKSPNSSDLLVGDPNPHLHSHSHSHSHTHSHSSHGGGIFTPHVTDIQFITPGISISKSYHTGGALINGVPGGVLHNGGALINGVSGGVVNGGGGVLHSGSGVVNSFGEVIHSGAGNFHYGGDVIQTGGGVIQSGGLTHSGGGNIYSAGGHGHNVNIQNAQITQVNSGSHSGFGSSGVSGGIIQTGLGHGGGQFSASHFKSEHSAQSSESSASKFESSSFGEGSRFFVGESNNPSHPVETVATLHPHEEVKKQNKAETIVVIENNTPPSLEVQNVGHILDVPIMREAEFFDENNDEQTMENVQNEKARDKRAIRLSSKVNKIELSKKHSNRFRRALPLTRLISDPIVKIDVDKTLENAGALARHTFENEGSPIYHVRNLVGSAKNTVLSALRIPPSDFLIPTQYNVVKNGGSQIMESRHSSRLGTNPPDTDNSSPFEPVLGDPNIRAINSKLVKEKINGNNGENSGNNGNGITDEVDQFGIVKTFERVGTAIKDSIQSGKDTLNHANEAASNAKNIVNTLQHIEPRFIKPLSPLRSAAHSRKGMLIVPRLLDINEDRVGSAADTSKASDFLHVGHIFDSVGISKPNPNKLPMEKIIFERTGPIIIRDELPNGLKIKSTSLGNIVGSKLPSGPENWSAAKQLDVEQALDNLEEAKELVGAANLKDFLEKMKEELNDIVEKKERILQQRQNKKDMHGIAKNNDDEAKGLNSGNSIVNPMNEIFFPNELMHPFMGMASSNDVKHYLEGNGVSNWQEYARHEGADQKAILSSTNPLMFEIMYNATLDRKAEEAARGSNPEVVGAQNPLQTTEEDMNPRSRTFMTLTGTNVRPFMGLALQENIHNYLENFNDNPNVFHQEDNAFVNNGD